MCLREGLSRCRSASFLQHTRNSRRNRQVVESVQAAIIRANIDDAVDYSRRGDDSASRLEAPELLASPGFKGIHMTVFRADINNLARDYRRSHNGIASGVGPEFS